jgi:serine/threonine-protein kinase
LARRRKTLTLKIFLGTGLVVAAVLGISLFLTSRSANATADESIRRGLVATRDQVQSLLQARERNLLNSALIFAGQPAFRSIIEARDPANALDQSLEAAEAIGADWVQITDLEGILMARSDDPGAPNDTLSGSALIGRALGGESVAGYGIAGDTALIQVVSVPIEGGAMGTSIGVLMAARGVNSDFLASVRASAGGETEIVAYFLDEANVPLLAATTVPASDELSTTLAGWTPKEPSDGAAEVYEEIILNEQHFISLSAPLLTAAGNPIGGFIVLRSREAEMAPFVALQNTILLSGGIGLFVAFLLSFAIAAQITRPVGALVKAANKAADGDYGASIAIKSSGEIGTLADAFNALIGDLRDKQALVDFLQGDSSGRTVSIEAVGDTLRVAASAQGIVPGSLLNRRYQIKEILGIGGMGTVYKAVDMELQEPVAIKTLKPEALSKDPSALERFKGEIRLARRISHRNVVRTHDLGDVDGMYFISMEYVEGKTLKDLVKSRKRLPVSATLTIGKQLLRALEVAHEQGVIHRDIKSQNMVVTADGVLKVMDFGIARLAQRSEGLTQAGMVVGTPEYMAPEQLLGDDIDARADLYSAGVVLYECLTGAVPFTAESAITLITKVLEETPRAPRDVNPEIPAALAELVMRALDKDANRRPQSATEFHDLLAAIG